MKFLVSDFELNFGSIFLFGNVKYITYISQCLS